MPIDEFLRLYPGYPVDLRLQLPFAYFLERRGQRFLVDFGLENAEEKVWDILESEEETDYPIGHA